MCSRWSLSTFLDRPLTLTPRAGALLLLLLGDGDLRLGGGERETERDMGDADGLGEREGELYCRQYSSSPTS